MAPQDEMTLDEVTFDELESVTQFEATFRGTLNSEEITVTYTLESAIEMDEDATVYTPGDDELEQVTVQPDTHQFETDDRDEIRFTATDDEDRELFLVYTFTEAEDSEMNTVDLSVN